MTPRSSALIAACLGFLAAESAHGEPRNATNLEPDRKAHVRADPVAEHAARLAKTDNWLRALMGQYRLSVLGTSLEGLVDCAGIGAGPGVHCIFSIGAPGQRDQWENAVMLFGIDNEGPGVHRFQLNRDSTAEMGVARLRGDAVTFPVECPVIQHYPPVISFWGVTTFTVLFCRRETRIHVGADGRFVRIRLSTFERVLVRPPGGRGQISEFPSFVEWTLERVQAP
jgi:hypothetical protein